jgi:hypothetical protein
MYLRLSNFPSILLRKNSPVVKASSGGVPANLYVPLALPVNQCASVVLTSCFRMPDVKQAGNNNEHIQLFYVRILIPKPVSM